MSFQQMLESLPGHISTSAREEPVAEVSYDGTCRMIVELDGDVLELIVSGGTGETARFTLSSYSTISSLVTVIDALTGFTAAVLDATLAALSPSAMVDCNRQLAEDDRLYCAGSVLWYILRLLADSAGSLLDSQMVALAQMNVFTAAGGWLDFWGWLYGILRFSGEDDTSFRRRLIWGLSLPRCDNRAIEEYLRRGMGIEAQVLDESDEVAHWNDQAPGLYLWYDIEATCTAQCAHEHTDGYLYVGTTPPLTFPILYRTSGTYHSLDSVAVLTTAGTIRCMGSFAGELFLGVDTTVLSYDGNTFTTETTMVNNIVAMVAAIGELWVLDAAGKIKHFDGTTWTAGTDTGLTVGRCLATYESTIVAGGHDGTGPSCEEYDSGGPSWAEIGSNRPGAGSSVYSLCQYLDGLRAGDDAGDIHRFIDPAWSHDENTTTEGAVVALENFDENLYAIMDSAVTAAGLHEYDGSSWTRIDDLANDGLALEDFSKIGELIIIEDVTSGRQEKFFQSVHSGNTDPSLGNDADGPYIGPGLFLWGFVVYADIPEAEEGEIHPLARVVQAVHEWKAAGTVFRIVDTTVAEAFYPTPAVAIESE